MVAFVGQTGCSYNSLSNGTLHFLSPEKATTSASHPQGHAPSLKARSTMAASPSTTLSVELFACDVTAAAPVLTAVAIRQIGLSGRIPRTPRYEQAAHLCVGPYGAIECLRPLPDKSTSSSASRNASPTAGVDRHQHRHEWPYAQRLSPTIPVTILSVFSTQKPSSPQGY
ncbi:hypothetical protein DENSPDRAFT_854316 [Dentipellis sp. KUC8613]|nr:hypothetical protein DENSPDRAFT_854316 [Dentipellis sp. KUC8613]